MAPYTGALTLAQYAAMSNDPIVTGTTFALTQHGSIFPQVPFVNRSSMVANASVWTNLPAVNWVNVNEEPTRVSAAPEPKQARAMIVRDLISTDRAVEEDMNQIGSPMANLVQAWLRAFAYNFNGMFINNTPVANAQAPYGIRYMLDNPVNFGLEAANKINGGSVDLKSSSMTASSFNTFMEYLDELLYRLDSPEGNDVVLIANDTLLRRMAFGARQFSGQGGFSQAQDALGRTITMYKSAMLLNAGRLVDQTTPIITNTETAAGANGSDHHTSIYGVRFAEDAFSGWQYYPLSPRPLGLNDTGVLYQTLCEWTGGFLIQSPRSIARLYAITMSS